MNKYPLSIRGLTCAAVLVAGPPGGQGQFRFVDPAKNLTILAKDGHADGSNPKSYVFHLKGDFFMKSISQGMTLTADEVRGSTQAIGDGKQELRHATATGNVHILQEVEKASAKQTTDIRGSSGDLDAVPAGDVVKLAGSVRIVRTDTQLRQTMVATGSSGVVTLEHGGKGKFGGMREGTLEGPVNVVLDREPTAENKQPAHVTAKGDHMEFTNTGAHPVITMTGHVEIHDPAQGDMTGLSKAVINLNQDGQVLTYQVESNRPGGGS
jgi:hypothetical protein